MMRRRRQRTKSSDAGQVAPANFPGEPDMRAQPAAAQTRRIVAGLPFVEALARRMAASMPNSIDIGDLVQDGVLGLKIGRAHV